MQVLIKRHVLYSYTCTVFSSAQFWFVWCGLVSPTMFFSPFWSLSIKKHVMGKDCIAACGEKEKEMNLPEERNSSSYYTF